MKHIFFLILQMKILSSALLVLQVIITMSFADSDLSYNTL